MSRKIAVPGIVGLADRGPVPDVELEDHCRYKVLLNARGVAASFRLKHLFLCNSLVFNVESPGHAWLEFFYPALVPWVHYVPVREDMSDAKQKLEWALDPANDKLARQIAQAGFELIRDHLTNTDVKEYWRLLMSEYAGLQRGATIENAGYKERLPDRHDPRRGLEEMTFPNL
eukprot:SAG22_NODE_752_length_7449_cov_8.296463_8_plen_173_part_00